MILHVDVPWILQVAELAGAGDPAPVGSAPCPRPR